jgi:hypothetical protein
MLPSPKSLWYAASVTDLKENIRSVYVGLGYMGYPVSWWAPTLRRFMIKYDLRFYNTLRAAHTREWRGDDIGKSFTVMEHAARGLEKPRLGDGGWGHDVGLAWVYD